MRRIAAVGHVHACPACAKHWLHLAYGCAADADLPCPEHPSQPEPPPVVRPAEALGPGRPIDPNWIKKAD